MKKITLKKFWEEIAPPMKLTNIEDDWRYFNDNVPPFSKNQIKNIILNDTEQQYYIMDDIAVHIAEKRMHPDVVFSLCLDIFFRNEEEEEYYKKILNELFRRVCYAIDSETGENIGFRIMHASDGAVSAFKELLQEEKIDKIVSHFLPTDGITPQYSEPAAYCLERKSSFSECNADEMQKSSFYSMIQKDIELAGAAFFDANGFTVEELEEDRYIQALLALNNSVTVLVDRETTVLEVIVW